MKYSKLLCIAVLAMAFKAFPAKAQQPTIPINTIVERSQKLFQVYPIEKVHMHFDKPYYAVGDTLWFKTYLSRNLAEYEPSKIVYVEVLNSRDSLIQTLRVPLKSGAGDGHLVLDPQFVKQDNYRFRAYTKWMGNFDIAYLFNKIVPIGDAINKNLQTHITFNDISNGSNAKAQATIQFKDGQGNILANNKLNWEVISGWETIDKGKSETDAMGKVQINLSAKTREALKNGKLSVNLNQGRAESNLVGDFSLENALWDADVQFFPEGGELIAGLNKKVAFKAIDANGKGISVKGKVLNKKNETLVSFEDLGLGMGSFPLLPISGEKYKAVISFPNGKEKTVDLPEVKGDAVNLIFHKKEGDNLQFAVVTGDEGLTKNENAIYYIMANSNGYLCFAAQVTLKNASVLVNIPIERFPNGVAQVTLMNTAGKPISERLVFIQAEKPLDIELKTDKSQYAAKGEVKLSIDAQNNGEKLPGTYSVSVVDETKVPYDDNLENTILSNFLLTSDIKGYIEKPNYYFNADNSNRLEALDALLMTQGYTRFSYEDIIAEKYPAINFLPEQGIEISGTLRLNTGRAVQNGGLLLSIPESRIRQDVYTDPNGKFVFKNLFFPDSVKATVNARGNDNYRNLVITMDQTYYPAIDKKNPYSTNAYLNIDEAIAPYLANSGKEFRTSILLDEVAITGVQKKKITNRDFSSLSGLSMPEHRIEPERLTGCNVLSMCLSTMLTGITYDSQTLKYYVSRDYNSGGRIPVQFFLNGMPIDESALNSIAIPDVEGIEIFLRDELGTVSRMYQNNGVVSIYTKKIEKQPRMSQAQIESMLPKSNVIDLYPLGYVKERVFYTPKYDTAERRATNDLRTTIYWNPNVLITEEGPAQLNFYNADGNGKYKVIVEGMDQTGNVGRQVLHYEVK